MFYPKPTQVVKRMRKAGEGRGRPQAASAQPKPAGSARRNRPEDGLACGRRPAPCTNKNPPGRRVGGKNTGLRHQTVMTLPALVMVSTISYILPMVPHCSLSVRP